MVALFPKAVVNPNSNYERYNDQQLVTFGQEYLGFLVFDLSMLPVHIVDAKLRLHVAWTNAARTKDKSTALLSLVDLSSWPNLSDKWERRPKISPPIHSWDAKKGAFLELDVTSLVIGAANLAWSKSLQMHKPPDDRIAFALSTPTGMWVKYDWNVPDDSLRPQLIFTFRGNGKRCACDVSYAARAAEPFTLIARRAILPLPHAAARLPASRLWGHQPN